MPTMRSSRLALAMALAGCTPAEQASTDAKSPPPPPVASATATPGDTTCRKEGLWAWCSVEDRMEHAGVILTRKDQPPGWDFLHGDGRAYTVGAGDDELHIYVYPDAAARQRDTDALDSAAVSPRGARRSYKVPPLLVTSNNLAALVFTLNERTSERLANALSAGLPQPRPR